MMATVKGCCHFVLWLQLKELYVREYEAYSYKQEIFYEYKLSRKNGLWQDISIKHNAVISI